MKLKLPILSAIVMICALAFSACSDGDSQSRTEIVQKASAVLATVRDRSSADRAAKEFSTLIQSLDKFEKPLPADALIADAAISAMFEQVVRLQEHNFYGSELLQKELGIESEK